MRRPGVPDARVVRTRRAKLHPLVPLLLAAVAVALLAGLAGGLLRAGVVLPGVGGADWVGHAAVWHGALMLGGFMGSMVGLERAVALRHPLAWCAPVLSGAAAVALLSGWPQAGAWAMALASVAFTGANAVLVRRQRAPHTVLLLAGAIAWLAGNLLLLAGAAGTALLPWWFAFLLLTVVAERLEMTRLMRRRPAAQPLLVLVLAGLLAAAAASAVDPVAGGVAYGAALVLLAAWLLVFDIARRTAAAQGLPRYMALCLLAGYAWLAIGGLAWSAAALGLPLRDAALHAIGLGFIGSMVLGHAPVILPAVARVKVRFDAGLYLPLAALHLSLLARLGPGSLDAGWRSWGAVCNVVALALFALFMVRAALAWRRAADHSPSQRADPPALHP